LNVQNDGAMLLSTGLRERIVHFFHSIEFLKA
jgi:hypothetical protein